MNIKKMGFLCLSFLMAANIAVGQNTSGSKNFIQTEFSVLIWYKRNISYGNGPGSKGPPPRPKLEDLYYKNGDQIIKVKLHLGGKSSSYSYYGPKELVLYAQAAGSTADEPRYIPKITANLNNAWKSTLLITSPPGPGQTKNKAVAINTSDASIPKGNILIYNLSPKAMILKANEKNYNLSPFASEKVNIKNLENYNMRIQAAVQFDQRWDIIYSGNWSMLPTARHIYLIYPKDAGMKRWSKNSFSLN